jgi:hypothetical protein
MSLARTWRTVRHLTAEQIVAMAVRCRRHARWRRSPDKSRADIAAAAASLPLPQLDDPRLGAIARHVKLLQQTIHKPGSTDLDRGRFSFLGRTVEFGGLDRIEWRRELGESSSPLWRLTLAYFGWAVMALATGQTLALRQIAGCLHKLDSEVSWGEPGVFRDIWNPYTASHRLTNLLAGLALGVGSGAQWTSDDVKPIVEHIRFCAAFVAADLERDLQLNHLLKDYVALASYAASLPEVPPAFEFLKDDVPRSLLQIVLPDGGHVERSPMYQALGLLDLRILRDSATFPKDWQPQLDRSIPAMEQALSLLTHPDGDVALFNDAWLGDAPSCTALGIRVADKGRHDLPMTGYSRLDGGTEVVILDSGPIGADFNPGHAHADFLSIEVSISGARFLVDPGTPTYAAGALRDLCRSAASHNGPRVVGAEPIEFWKSFRVGRRGRAGLLNSSALAIAPLWTAGWQDGYRDQGLEPRRWVGLWPGQALVVVDLWRGYAGNDVVSNFLIPAEWAVEAGEHRFRGPVSIETSAPAGRLEPVAPAIYWPHYGREAAATELIIRPNRDGVSTVIFSWSRLPFWESSLQQLVPALAAAERVTIQDAENYRDRQ